MKIQKGHHDSYLLCASSKQEMEEWMDAISRQSFDNQFKALMERRLGRVMKNQAAEESIQFGHLMSRLQFCSACSLDKDALRQRYPMAIWESPHKGIQFCLIPLQQHRTQSLVVVGNKWSSCEDLHTQAKKRSNLLDHYSVLAIAKHIRRTIQKSLLKDFKFEVVGHSLGGSIAILVAQLFQEKGTSVSNVVTFGAPRIFSSEQLKDFKDVPFPILQVLRGDDAVPLLFEGYHSVGNRLILLQGAHFCWLDSSQTDKQEPAISPSQMTETGLSHHTIDEYEESLEAKVSFSVAVQYHLRNHYQ